MKTENELNREYAKELSKLILANATLRVMAWIDSEGISDDYACWGGNLGMPQIQTIAYSKADEHYIERENLAHFAAGKTLRPLHLGKKAMWYTAPIAAEEPKRRIAQKTMPSRRGTGGRMKKKIIRVFPRKTSFSPTDEYAFFGEPPFEIFIPAHDEVHIVVIFTWDIERGRQLQSAWEVATNKPVKIGGPAFDDPCTGEFVPGRYIKSGVTFTSRGCCNNCQFCFVPKREGKLRELAELAPGNIIQDNNFLACSKEHRAKVYEMLKNQKAISFRGGLEAARLSDWDIEQMRGLRIAELWLACDSKERVKSFLSTMERLRAAGFNRNKIRCYTLIGDDMEENISRLETVFLAGALPFAQLYQPPEHIEYSKEWRNLSRTFSRPAATKAYMKAKGLWDKDKE